MLKRCSLILTLSLVFSGVVIAAETPIVVSKIDLGTLRADNSGRSAAYVISADGHVVAGTSDTDNDNDNAFIWSESGSKMINIGTPGVLSYVSAVSADGRVAVLSSNDDDNHYSRALIWRDNDQKTTCLGTLTADNEGNSRASGISADGRVVVGNASSDNGFDAFIWREADNKMTRIAPLNADSDTSLYASNISADGSVVVGFYPRVTTDHRPILISFIWRVGDTKMIELSTIEINSSATAVSADGTVVVGEADINSSGYNTKAFIWKEADGMTSLGTLEADNSGSSKAYGISADGRVVVGESDTDNNSPNAFIWREGDTKMTNLGTLRADNSGSSIAYGVSADGTVVVGQAETDNGDIHAVIWQVE